MFNVTAVPLAEKDGALLERTDSTTALFEAA